MKQMIARVAKKLVVRYGKRRLIAAVVGLALAGAGVASPEAAEAVTAAIIALMG